jgi:hypothetical protein
MSTQAPSQADGPLISKNELDLGCKAGQTIVHASPVSQPMEVDEPSVSSRAGLPAIPVNDHVSPMPKGGLPRASQRLEDLTSHGLTRGTLQICPSPQEMCGVVGSVQWLWVAQALGFSPISFVPKDPESERIASALWPMLHLSLSAIQVFDEHPVPLVFSSKRLDSTLWHHPALRWVVSSTDQRPAEQMWSESRIKVQHSLVHGITDGSALVCLCGLTQYWDGDAVPTYAHSHSLAVSTPSFPII